MKKTIWLVLSVTIIALVFFGVKVVVATSDPVIQQFFDNKRGTYLSIHSDPYDLKFGNFSYYIAGNGTYVGGNKSSIRLKGGGGVIVNFKGNTVFFSDNGEEGVRNVVANIEAGPKVGFATAVLIDQTTKKKLSYQMISTEPVEGTETIIADIGNALTSSNWNALYGLISSTFTDGQTQDEFSSDLSSQEVEFGKVVGYEALSEPELQFSPLSGWFFSLPVRYSYEKGGEVVIEEHIDYYIYEDAWKFWFSGNE